MSGIDEFRGYSPKEVAEMTGLFGVDELKLKCSKGEIPHHRGARNKIVFFPEDIKALKQMTRQAPKKKQAATPLAAVAAEVELINPFRSTPRSRAVHRARQSA